MALSDHEQRLLDEMERSLYQNDADIVSTTPGTRSRISARGIVLALLAVILGLGALVVSIVARLPWLGVIAFAIMVLAVVFGLFGGSGSRKGGPEEPGSNDRGTRDPDRDAGKSYIERLEDRWDRRVGGDDR